MSNQNGNIIEPKGNYKPPINTEIDLRHKETAHNAAEQRRQELQQMKDEVLTAKLASAEEQRRLNDEDKIKPINNLDRKIRR